MPEIDFRYVTVNRAAELLGMSPAAVRKRIERGVWLENREWRRGPDGRLYVDLKGLERWIETA